MKNILLQIALAIVISYSATAQTQKIAFKSHNSSSADFTVDEDSKDDFGLAPWMTYREMEQDTVGLRKFLQTEKGKKLAEWMEKQPETLDIHTRDEQGKVKEFWEGFKETTKDWMEDSSVPFSAEDFRSGFYEDYEKTRKLILNNSEKGLLKYKSQGAIWENTGKVVFGIAFLLGVGWLYKEST